MPGPLLPLLIGAAVPVVVRYLQLADAEDERRAEGHRRKVEATTETMARVTSKLSQRLSHVYEAMCAVVFDRNGNEQLLAEDVEAWKAYRAVASDWTGFRVEALARVDQYFGTPVAKQLERLDELFEILDKQVNAGHYKRTDSQFYIEDNEGSPNDFRTKFFPVRDSAMEQLRALTITMLQKVDALGKP